MSEEKDSFQGFFNKVGKIGQYIQEGYKKATSITGYEVFQKLENLQIKKAQYTDEKKVEKIRLKTKNVQKNRAKHNI
mgnify:CR=1 FL=1